MLVRGGPYRRNLPLGFHDGRQDVVGSDLHNAGKRQFSAESPKSSRRYASILTACSPSRCEGLSLSRPDCCRDDDYDPAELALRPTRCLSSSKVMALYTAL